MLLIGFISSICISCTFETLVFDLKWTDWILITVHSGTYGLKIPLEMHVASRLPGVVIAVIASTSIIYGWIAQYTFLKHIHSGYMNWVEVCGICCVIIASIIPSVVKSCTSSWSWLKMYKDLNYPLERGQEALSQVSSSEQLTMWLYRVEKDTWSNVCFFECNTKSSKYIFSHVNIVISASNYYTD